MRTTTTTINDITYHIDDGGHFASCPKGAIEVPPGVAAGLARDLAQPELRDWQPRQWDTPEPPVPLRAAGAGAVGQVCAIVDACQEAHEQRLDPHADRFWAPRMTRDQLVITWRPWSAAPRTRHITIDIELGRVSWDSGTGRPSRFIGRALAACAAAVVAA